MALRPRNILSLCAGVGGLELGILLALASRGEVGRGILFEDLGCDSLDRMSLAVALEEALGAEFRDHEITRWRTVGDVVACAERKTTYA